MSAGGQINLDIIEPTDNQTFTTIQPTISGTAPAGTTITLTFQEQNQSPSPSPISRTAPTDANGKWSSTDYLKNGTYTLEVIAKDQSGTEVGRESVDLTVDAPLPDIKITKLTFMTNMTKKPPIQQLKKIEGSGNGAEIKKITLEKNGEEKEITLENIEYDGQKWSCTPEETEENLINGEYTLTVTAKDKAGNESAANVTFTIPNELIKQEFPQQGDSVNTWKPTFKFGLPQNLSVGMVSLQNQGNTGGSSTVTCNEKSDERTSGGQVISYSYTPDKNLWYLWPWPLHKNYNLTVEAEDKDKGESVTLTFVASITIAVSYIFSIINLILFVGCIIAFVYICWVSWDKYSFVITDVIGFFDYITILVGAVIYFIISYDVEKIISHSAGGKTPQKTWIQFFSFLGDTVLSSLRDTFRMADNVKNGIQVVVSFVIRLVPMVILLFVLFYLWATYAYITDPSSILARKPMEGDVNVVITKLYGTNVENQLANSLPTGTKVETRIFNKIWDRPLLKPEHAQDVYDKLGATILIWNESDDSNLKFILMHEGVELDYAFSTDTQYDVEPGERSFNVLTDFITGLVYLFTDQPSEAKKQFEIAANNNSDDHPKIEGVIYFYKARALAALHTKQRDGEIADDEDYWKDAMKAYTQTLNLKLGLIANASEEDRKEKLREKDDICLYHWALLGRGVLYYERSKEYKSTDKEYHENLDAAILKADEAIAVSIKSENNECGGEYIPSKGIAYIKAKAYLLLGNINKDLAHHRQYTIWDNAKTYEEYLNEAIGVYTNTIDAYGNEAPGRYPARAYLYRGEVKEILGRQHLKNSDIYNMNELPDLTDYDVDKLNDALNDYQEGINKVESDKRRNDSEIDQIKVDAHIRKARLHYAMAQMIEKGEIDGNKDEHLNQAKETIMAMTEPKDEDGKPIPDSEQVTKITDTSRVDLYNLLGKVQEMEGETEQAQDAFDKALESLNSISVGTKAFTDTIGKRIELYTQQGKVLSDTNKIDEAKEALSCAMKWHGSNTNNLTVDCADDVPWQNWYRDVDTYRGIITKFSLDGHFYAAQASAYLGDIAVIEGQNDSLRYYIDCTSILDIFKTYRYSLTFPTAFQELQDHCYASQSNLIN
jgi:tetratricopeptide (TPR) repeat protein